LEIRQRLGVAAVTSKTAIAASPSAAARIWRRFGMKPKGGLAASRRFCQ
jgi:hypothetical protein